MLLYSNLDESNAQNVESKEQTQMSPYFVISLL